MSEELRTNRIGALPTTDESKHALSAELRELVAKLKTEGYVGQKLTTDDYLADIVWKGIKTTHDTVVELDVRLKS